MSELNIVIAFVQLRTFRSGQPLYNKETLISKGTVDKSLNYV